MAAVKPWAACRWRGPGGQRPSRRRSLSAASSYARCLAALLWRRLTAAWAARIACSEGKACLRPSEHAVRAAQAARSYRNSKAAEQHTRIRTAGVLRRPEGRWPPGHRPPAGRPGLHRCRAGTHPPQGGNGALAVSLLAPSRGQTLAPTAKDPCLLDTASMLVQSNHPGWQLLASSPLNRPRLLFPTACHIRRPPWLRQGRALSQLRAPTWQTSRRCPAAVALTLARRPPSDGRRGPPAWALLFRHLPSALAGAPGALIAVAGAGGRPRPSDGPVSFAGLRLMAPCTEDWTLGAGCSSQREMECERLDTDCKKSALHAVLFTKPTSGIVFVPASSAREIQVLPRRCCRRRHPPLRPTSIFAAR